MKKFAVFILSHGRPNNVKTVKALKKSNYSGDFYIIIDNEDDSSHKYYKNYGDKVIMFDKKESAKYTDTADNFRGRQAVVYARNTVHQIAENLGLTHFLVLDDDYNNFEFRYEDQGKLRYKVVQNADKLFDKTLDFLDESGSLAVCYAQSGDFIGGVDNGNYRKGILRKAMNVFFCRTDRPFKFYGKINEDLTTYILLGGQGEKFFTLTRVSIGQTQTQSNDKGLTDIYLDLGTYVKSFYSVIFCPSCVSVAPMGDKNKRIHHRVAWNNAVPKIISPEHKK